MTNAHWGLQGYKWRPSSNADEKGCDRWYPGSRPFQAPETNNIANFVWTLPHLKVFLDLQSYGQMSSWSMTTTPARSTELHRSTSIIPLLVLVQTCTKRCGRPAGSCFGRCVRLGEGPRSPIHRWKPMFTALPVRLPNPTPSKTFRQIDSLRSTSAPGNAADWMYQRRGIKYSYTVHLRDTGTVSLNACRCTYRAPFSTHI
jgi:extracellular matrix protein 14